MAPAARRALLAALLVAALAGRGRAEEPSFAVSYVSERTVYLAAGSADGLAVGDRLLVRRDGAEVAEVEVAFVARHSASCRITLERSAVEPGDVAVVLARAERSEPPPSPERPASGEGPEPPPVVDHTGYVFDAEPPAPWASTSGVLSLGFQEYRDDRLADGGFREQTGRLRLRASDIGGRPLELRLRLRAREDERDRGGSERSDRLYEASLAWQPAGGRFSLLLGRLGAGPFVTLGYLDGVLGEVQLLPVVAVGAFAGRQPRIEELGFDGRGSKYGAFVRLATREGREGLFGELVLAGVGAYGDGGLVDREYVAVESRLGSSTGRWSLYQLAELDLSRDWDDAATAQESQLSSLSLSGFFRFSDAVRGSLSYDRRRNYRTIDTRLLPEEVFDDLLREGLRAGLHASRGDWYGSLSAGVRSREGESEPTYSAGLALARGDVLGWGLLLGGDASFYTGDVVEGWLVALRASRSFGRGHDVALVVGASQADIAASFVSPASSRGNQWARLSATVQLPARLYLLAELEVDQGDDLEGQRWIAELGYRF